MRPSSIQRLAVARDESDACKCFTAETRTAVWQLAQDLESAELWRSAALALELTRLAADTTGENELARAAAARAGFISSFAKYHFRGEVDAGLNGLWESADAFAAGGQIERAVSTLVMASRIALKHGRPEHTFAAAMHALDLLSSAGGSNISFFQMYGLALDIFERGAGPQHAVFFARANSVFQTNAESQAAASAAALLGCTLIRMGDAESGLAILQDIDHTLRRSRIRYNDGSVGPLPEMVLVQYWKARGLALTGRLMEAERAFRDHPWMDPSHREPRQRDKIVSRAVEVLIELERYNDALQMLNEHLEGREASNDCGCALLLSEMAVLDALLGHPKLAAIKISEVRQVLPELVSSNEMVLRTRLHVLDASLIAQNGDPPALESELAAIESGAAAHPGEIMPFEFDRFRGDLALMRSDVPQALSHYGRALEGAWSVPTDQPWIAHWKSPSNLPADLEGMLHAHRIKAARRHRAVGLRMQLGIARAEALAGEDPTPMLDDIIGLASAANRASTLFYALYEKSKVARVQRNSSALGLLERCMDVLEALRGDIQDISLQIGTIADKESVYGDVLELALAAPAQPDLAMRVMERAKGRGLLDQMTAGHVEAVSRERDMAGYLRRKIVRLLRRELAQKEDVGFEIRRTKELLGSVFQRQYARLATSVPPVTPEDVVSFTARGTAVLHYFVDTRGAFACVAASGRLHAPVFLPHATPDTIAALLDSFAFERKSRQWPRSLAELYAILVEPLRAELLGASRLLVLPHRILHQVPFHALLSSDTRYLAEDFVMSYAPSASFVLRLGRTVRREPESPGPSVVLGVSRTTYLPLEMLGSVQEEVTEVARRLGNPCVLQEDEAGRRTLLDLRGDINVLHLACHGEFDEDDPMLSRLYLADGPIYAYELLGLAARARLTVLSACESGVRTVEAGDESFGLIRPLLTVGSDAVLSSLWKISDRGTAAFMNAFYEQRGQFASDAPRCLAETQRALIQSVEYAHPYYWAPYMMVAP
jgi:CHAT domain-containing protein